MNQEARDKLVEAELRGVPQIRGSYSNSKGKCALGVLGYPDLVSSWKTFRLEDTASDCPFLHTDLQLPTCPITSISEPMLVIHLNDDHGLSFLDIARKFPEPIE